MNYKVEDGSICVSSSPAPKIARSFSELDLAVNTKLHENPPYLNDDKEKVL